MDKQTYKILLAIMFTITIILIIHYMLQKPKIMTEGMDAAQMIFPTVQDWIVPKEFYYKKNYYYVNRDKQNPDSQPSFYIKSGEGSCLETAEQKARSLPKDPLNFYNYPLGDVQYNWDSPLQPGVDGNYKDLLWNYMSPKMMLLNTNLNCSDSKKSSHEPEGVMSDITNMYDGTILDGKIIDHKILGNM